MKVSKLKTRFKAVFLMLLVFIVSFTLTYNYKSSLSDERYVKTVQSSLPKVVTISCLVSRLNDETHQKEYGRFIGSGVFISSQGHILSCAHLFNSPYTLEEIWVQEYNGDTLKAVFLYKDDDKDLSLIRIWDKTSPVKLADPRDIKEGQEVIAIGSPLDFDGTVTTGIISALHRDEFHYDMLQMSAPINPGNSGGPLFNRKGELVGINVLIVSPIPFFAIWSGIGFSVSASEINRFLTDYKKTFNLK